MRRSIGAVDDEKGVKGVLGYKGSYVNGQFTPQVAGGFDLGFALPLAHSSLWLRTAGGFANGDRNSTVANFYFGGFGNNYVDDKSIKRYREYSSFPGFGIDEISALSFVREMVELNVPPYVFESAGTPSLYLPVSAARRCSSRDFGRTPAIRRCARTTQASGDRSTSISASCTDTT